MTAPTVLSSPDLVIPSGRITLRTVAEGRAAIEVSETEELEVLLPAGTQYFLEIGRVFVARWRAATTLDGIWSFWCEVGKEKAWLETDGTNWQFNHSIAPPDAQAQSNTPLAS